jgi:hypothetical protein
MSLLSTSDAILRHVPAVAEESKGNSSVGRNRQPGNARVVEIEAQPGFGGKLEGATDKVANHICMANKEGVGRRFLGWWSAVEMCSETSFDSCALLEEFVRQRVI